MCRFISCLRPRSASGFCHWAGLGFVWGCGRGPPGWAALMPVAGPVLIVSHYVTSIPSTSASCWTLTCSRNPTYFLTARKQNSSRHLPSRRYVTHCMPHSDLEQNFTARAIPACSACLSLLFSENKTLKSQLRHLARLFSDLEAQHLEHTCMNTLAPDIWGLSMGPQFGMIGCVEPLPHFSCAWETKAVSLYCSKYCFILTWRYPNSSGRVRKGQLYIFGC